MSIEAMKAIQMVYANTTKHDWPDDIWDAICQAIEVEKKAQEFPKRFDTHPQPKREWVGLTLADKEEYIAQDFGGNRLDAMDWAEAKLKEKNT